MAVKNVQPVFTAIIKEGLTEANAAKLDEALGDVISDDEQAYVDDVTKLVRTKAIAAEPKATQLVLALPDTKQSRFGAIARSAGVYSSAGAGGGAVLGAVFGSGFGPGGSAYLATAWGTWAGGFGFVAGVIRGATKD